ncbi:hypothetical protein GUITHDRAFT_142865 [Guillardia theta CCMP2712]|uniref:Uncharacterized protein n=1 Tax=Guillardia theta (strain CCMP2712) TaxID=905079 RepID=L1IVW7_GUITC|nr:hypothetical protein GUITHDRAFT_142865 [Guillardia theta CCMP2712]EKX40371.1 hypothetical protein GUITHDRAFT_142865 [Guillardia theta CCMP2712]|eukprot:XP_005827351.1 hypothetical protein GUITHDRAFT_142865 [Guillardia theta CCMP2712]
MTPASQRLVAILDVDKELESCRTQLRKEWADAYGWLLDMGFIERSDPNSPPDPFAPGQKLTPRGYACAAFADGYPLVLGTVVADGGLEHLTLAEIASWLCLFLREGRSRGPPGRDGRNKESMLQLPEPSPALLETFDYTDELAYHFEAVMRVISYMEVLKDVLLGLGFYEMWAHPISNSPAST